VFIAAVVVPRTGKSIKNVL